jgi:hypothetical protein
VVALTNSFTNVSFQAAVKEQDQQNRAKIWGIEARAFPIPYTPFTHNFWALTGSNACIIDQLHGLAVDPVTGATMAFGSSRHRLMVIQRADIVWSMQPNQPTAICATGPETEIRQRWQAAVNAIPALNSLNLPYPDWWQHTYKANSNSVFTTLGMIMGFPSPQTLLTTWAPGIKLIISAEIVAKYCHQG